MQRGERPVVTGIHGLKHFQRLSAAALANDYSVGTHTQCVTHLITKRDFAYAFGVGFARFHTHYMRMLRKTQFR